MKREMKFRGKIASENLEELISCELEIPHKNGWVEGSFVEPNLITGRVADIDWDYFATEWWVKVIPESVGEFTGLKDKNGVKIYEGDVVRFTQEWEIGADRDEIEVVQFQHGGFTPMCRTLGGVYYECQSERYEVIGNVHDNPELKKYI